MLHFRPNTESLRLYRDVLRLSRLFTWSNEKGEPWRNIVRNNARKEFEEARYERDPIIVARLLFVGRDCLKQTSEKLRDKVQAVQDHVDKTRTR